MIGDALVVDAVAHGFDISPTNIDMAPGELHHEAHVCLSPSSPKYSDYVLSAERWEHPWNGAELASCFFAESQTDIAAYHVVRQRVGYTSKGEWSPMKIARQFRDAASPGRVYIYGGVNDPFDVPRSIDEIDQMIEEDKIIGLKMYPHVLDARAGRVRSWLFNDEAVAFPILEHCLKRGIKAVGVHKAMGSVVSAFGVADLDAAVLAFPDLQFEIVHAGWAFMEDTAILAARPNVYLNLEGTASLVATAPRRFAEVIGRFLRGGGGEPNAEDRILWATGAMAVHPQPLIELFWNFQMPEDLMEGYGYPEVDEKIKRKILGGNYARKLGVEPADLLARIPDSPERQAQVAGRLARPWSKVAEAAGAEVSTH
jgi:predicted TIM-barrel fold metal-dependent hydrolase